MNPELIYAPPTLDDMHEDTLPDPEGFAPGREDFGFVRGGYVQDNDYDDGGYEPDVDYGFND